MFYYRLRAANALLIGIRGLGSEIAKNILLSGINSLTILDNETVTKEEQLVNFLLDPDTIGKNVSIYQQFPLKLSSISDDL